MVPAVFKPILKPSSPWLTPVGPNVLRGGLRTMVNQFSDGRSNIFVPKHSPNIKRSEFTYVLANG